MMIGGKLSIGINIFVALCLILVKFFTVLIFLIKCLYVYGIQNAELK